MLDVLKGDYTYILTSFLNKNMIVCVKSALWLIVSLKVKNYNIKH